MRAVDPRLLRVARAATVALASAVVLGLLTAGLATAQAFLLADAISPAFLGGATLGALAAGARGPGPRARGPRRYRLGPGGGRPALLGVGQADPPPATPGPRRRPRPGWAAGVRSGEVVALATRGLDALDAYFGRYLPQLVLAVIVPVVVVVALAWRTGWPPSRSS